MDIGPRKPPDGRIFQLRRKRIRVRGRIVQTRNVPVDEAADAHHQRPLLLHRSQWRRGGAWRFCRVSFRDEAAPGRRGQHQGIQSLLQRFGIIEPRLVHRVFRQSVVAQPLFNKASVIPRIAQLAALLHGMLEQLQSIFKRVVIAIRRDSLQCLNYQVFARAASVVLP